MNYPICLQDASSVISICVLLGLVWFKSSGNNKNLYYRNSWTRCIRRTSLNTTDASYEKVCPYNKDVYI